MLAYSGRQGGGHGERELRGRGVGVGVKGEERAWPGGEGGS